MGVAGNKKNISLAQVKAVKTGKADRAPAVAKYFKALLAELEASPHLFPAPAPDTTQLSPSELDRHYLQRAMELAAASPDPVGCGTVIVHEGKILAEAFNSQRADNRAVAHAEVKAVTEANRHTGSRTLRGATAYCSCEPCAMCLAALSYAKIERIVFNLRMADLFPVRTQSQLDPHTFVKGLDFQPKLEQLKL